MLKKILVTLISLTTLAGCANKPDNQLDPYEGYNRAMFKFNHDIDYITLRPVASVYDAIVPNPVKEGVTNFFDNLDMIPTVANDILQTKFQYAIADTCRFLVNSTIGLFGLFDMAKHINLPPHHETLGLTFAHWGAKNSPYFVIPLLGPSTIRDTVAYPINYRFLTVYPRIHSQTLAYGLLATRYVDLRAQLLPADKLVDEAFDPYIFVRDAYLQRQQKLIKQSDKEEALDTYVEELIEHDKADNKAETKAEDKNIDKHAKHSTVRAGNTTEHR
ncbi:MAG: VacJ family lipoprotein [Gammaproteobacteria bacterium]|nr:VacJ family lipoprotein [Gammaproteobacteria bacterium]